jgi:hypothetical protein
VVDWPVKNLLDLLESVRRLLSEQVGINTPVLELHIEHTFILFLLFVQLSAISDKIKHETEGLRVSVDKYLVILFLKAMAA